jgi:hypothetical protein
MTNNVLSLDRDAWNTRRRSRGDADFQSVCDEVGDIVTPNLVLST